MGPKLSNFNFNEIGMYLFVYFLHIRATSRFRSATHMPLRVWPFSKPWDCMLCTFTIRVFRCQQWKGKKLWRKTNCDNLFKFIK